MSEKYDYESAIKSDIMDWLNEHYDSFISDDERSDIYDRLFVCDSVTGNASGSYTFSAWEAEENICHNIGLLTDALNEFGYHDIPFTKGAEWCDVTIRCYLLGQCLDDCIFDWNEEHPEPEDDEEGEEGNESVDEILAH